MMIPMHVNDHLAEAEGEEKDEDFDSTNEEFT